VGGAGLFSDGKHSHFPSASALWALPDRRALGLAYERVSELLRPVGVELGELPASTPPSPNPGQWQPRPYTSTYVSLAARRACIDELWSSATEQLSGATVVSARREGGGFVLTLEDASGRREVHGGRVVVATGRWSPTWTRPWLEGLGARFAWRRVEFGVRLELGADAAIFTALPGVDGKLVWRGDDAELRTFCTCRNGEVVLGAARGLQGYSGRADGPPTGRSSFGLLVRIEDEAVGRALQQVVLRAQPRATPLEHWRKAGAAVFAQDFGVVGGHALHRALERLCDWHPPLRDEPATIYSPCLEGIGDYPVIDGALAVAPGVSVVGDATGRFRGIVASMVSGRYAALAGAAPA
jgi:hypothetical protein